MEETIRGDFTHLHDGHAHMVEVGAKPVTARSATAQAVVQLQPATLARINAGAMVKGNVLETARLAGIQAAKRTADLIPLCHPLALTGVTVEFNTAAATDRITITATARAVDRTGVEMEALTAASVAALTVYDMCKAVERGIRISDICLLEKSGGRSGEYRLPEAR
ncbi:MAG TPA: cyclic pyranopterin monophosphate synthase MoaC [bacterium]|nr:cyclic pyranopterin monophosphate synthase MoaC [bacterium]